MTELLGPDRRATEQRADRFADVITAELKRLGRETAKQLDQTAPSETDLTGVGASWDRITDDILLPVIESEWMRAANEMWRQVADWVEAETGGTVVRAAAEADQYEVPPVSIQAAETYLADARNRLVGIGDAAWQDMRAQLLEGLQQGESIVELQQRIRQTYTMTEGRATVIARTEVIGATNRGALNQMSMIGLPGMKHWLATHDGRTRQSHRIADGQTVPMGAKFIVGSTYMDGPHDPFAPPRETVQCRCTLTYEVHRSGIEQSNISILASAVTAAVESHTGAMIALVPSEQDIARLAVEGGESASELHLTLWFLGEASAYSAEDRSAITHNVMTMMDDFKPITARVFGVGLWNPGGAEPAIVLNVGDDAESPHTLSVIREKLSGDFYDYGGDGEDVVQHSPWSPHICLAYSKDPGMIDAALDRIAPVTFDMVRIAFGTDVLDVTML